jgi:hypothetical protein
MSYQMLASHFQEQQESGQVGRVEFLPVRWHSALHGDATGIDRYGECSPVFEPKAVYLRY